MTISLKLIHFFCIFPFILSFLYRCHSVQTGEVKSPYPNLRVEDCRMYAFAGIHLFCPSLLPLMEAWPTRFSIIDFYLSIADKVPIIGVPKSDLQLIDVGKPDTLHQVPQELLG